MCAVTSIPEIQFRQKHFYAFGHRQFSLEMKLTEGKKKKKRSLWAGSTPMTSKYDLETPDYSLHSWAIRT